MVIKNLENNTQKMQAKEGSVYDNEEEFQKRDLELERMVGDLFVAEYQIKRLEDRLTNNGVTVRTINMFLGHGQPKKDGSEFSFKCKTNGKVYRVSIGIHRANRIDNDDDANIV